MQEEGFYKGKKDNIMRIAICSRSGDILEPVVKSQWYVKMKEMASSASQFVKDGKIEIYPSFYKEEWFRWMDNIKDWCISRQLWWGHRIPAYRIKLVDEQYSKNQDFWDSLSLNFSLMEEKDWWIVARSEEEAKEVALKKFNWLSNLNYSVVQVSSFSLLLLRTALLGR